MAPRVASGRYLKSGVRKSKVRKTSAAVTNEESWLLSPAASLAAVLERLPFTANPWKSPAPTFDRPLAIISWLVLIRYWPTTSLASPPNWSQFASEMT